MQSAKVLQCSYCQTELKLVNPTSAIKYTSFGLLSCLCDTYPIVEGIVFCKKDDNLLHRRISKCIKDGNYYRAVWLSLKGHHFFLKLITYLIYLLRQRKIKVSEYVLLKFLSVVGPGRSWFKYLLMSSSRNTLQTATTLLLRNRELNQVIVDVGCGFGYLGNNLQTHLRRTKSRIVALDKSMLFLLCAQMFHHSPYITYIVADIEAGLPLKARSVTQVVYLDSFAWIYSKFRALQDTSRILKKRGELLIVNVHVPSLKTSDWGYGITPQILKRYMNPFFSQITFFANDLKEKNTVQKFAQVNPLGYSCQALKKNS